MHDHEKRFDPKKRETLLGRARWERWNPPHLLRLSGVTEGMTVADLGCGPGFWTLPLAGAIGPRGRVIALDVSRELMRDLAALHPPAQVELVQAELPTIPLPDGSVDLIWAAFVFHEVEPPAPFAVEMRRVLRPGGKLAVLDWRPDAASADGTPRHHRVSPDQVRVTLSPAGFGSIESLWQNEDAYLLGASIRKEAKDG